MKGVCGRLCGVKAIVAHNWSLVWELYTLQMVFEPILGSGTDYSCLFIRADQCLIIAYFSLTIIELVVCIFCIYFARTSSSSGRTRQPEPRERRSVREFWLITHIGRSKSSACSQKSEHSSLNHASITCCQASITHTHASQTQSHPRT